MLKEVITFHTTNPQILLTKSKQKTPFLRKPWLSNIILFSKVWFFLCLICVLCRYCCAQRNICQTLMVLSSGRKQDDARLSPSYFWLLNVSKQNDRLRNYNVACFLWAKWDLIFFQRHMESIREKATHN